MSNEGCAGLALAAFAVALIATIVITDNLSDEYYQNQMVDKKVAHWEISEKGKTKFVYNQDCTCEKKLNELH